MSTNDFLINNWNYLFYASIRLCKFLYDISIGVALDQNVYFLDSA